MSTMYVPQLVAVRANSTTRRPPTSIPLSATSTPGAADRILRSGGQRQGVIASRVGIEPGLPELVKAATRMDTAQGQDIFGSGLTPKHARVLATGTDDGLTAGFHDACANEAALRAEGAILHAGSIVDEIAQFFFHRCGSGFAQAFLAALNNEFIHPVLEQLLGPPPQPLLVVGVFFAAQ